MATLVLAVANQKGGCGKTTTIMNLAGGLSKAGYKVLVVDADPQASAVSWSIARGQAKLPFAVCSVDSPGLSGRFSSLLTLGYDIVLIDCPPGVTTSQDAAGRFSRAAVEGSDAILIPLRASRTDFAAARAFVTFLVHAKAPETKTAVLINARQRTKLGNMARAQAAKDFAPIEDVVILETTIGERAAIAEVCGSGETIFDWAPRSTAAEEYQNLTKEVIQWLTATSPSTPATSPLPPLSPQPAAATSL